MSPALGGRTTEKLFPGVDDEEEEVEVTGGPSLAFVASPSLTRPFFFPNGDHLDAVLLAEVPTMAGTTSDDETAGGVEVDAAVVG